ncbi:TBC1 domain family member 22B [Durusdinium trenchii]|uniref:TBC1 domain family member 22B n=1 Tax=Durusdinium trenchii TaxID=1381693 RepID=A0ABP0KRH0_9DINO
MVWQLLLGYLPTRRERRDATLRRKRREYFDCLPMYYNNSDADRSEEDQKMLRQILLDIPRTNPGMPLFHSDLVRRSFERILYIWAIRHPASGYVQGMNDLVTPFYVVFLADHISSGDVDQINACDVSTLEQGILDAVEADSYWCLTKLLDGIQDHYTMSQPGLQRMVYRLQGIIQRIDRALHDHLTRESVDFNQFAFRWMNCLLVRELELHAIIRLWDTYLAEEREGFDSFHVYVCAALLVTWSKELQAMGFQELIIFLQDLPTGDWDLARIQELLGQAYILKTLFNESPSHLG